MPYSQQQLENALRKADAAGDIGAAQTIANELRQLKAGAAPRAQAAPSSPSSWLGDIGGGLWAGAKGVAKGAVGDVVGAGQIASDIPGVKNALKAIPGVAEDVRGVRDWTRSGDPNYPTMGELGRIAGAAAPFAATMPLTGLGALADAVAFGGLTGLVQPTEGGDWTKDIPAHAEEALKGGLYGGATGLGGLALQRLAPFVGAAARNLPPWMLGHAIHHPWLTWHLLRNTAPMKAIGTGASSAVRNIGKGLTRKEVTGAAGAEGEAPTAGDPNSWRGTLRYGEQ